MTSTEFEESIPDQPKPTFQEEVIVGRLFEMVDSASKDEGPDALSNINIAIANYTNFLGTIGLRFQVGVREVAAGKN